MNARVHKYIFLVIIFIASILRLYQLGQTPPSPDWDEAALGYNAYSILKTGRDEYGTWFPLSLRSFDDYKPPLYMYLAIPSVALFGLKVWAVRLPSVIMGVFAVAGTFLLVSEFFRNKKNYSFSIQHSAFSIPIVSSLLLAISPWHIQFSRIAFEANIGVTINIWAVLCFLKGIKNRFLLYVSAFLFGLGFYAYHSERIFIPLLVLMLFGFYRKELLIHKRNFIFAFVVGLITIAPLVPIFINQNTLMRLRGTSSLADQTGLLMRSVKKLEEDKVHGNPWGILFDNRRLVWVKTVTDGYLSHYSLRWLFLTGDNPRHHAPDMGLLYLWELPFFLYGFYVLFIYGGKPGKIVMGWFLIAPIAASPTTELPHAIRTLVFLPTFQIITAVGLILYISRISKYVSLLKYKKYFGPILTVFHVSLIAFNLIYYFHMYFVHMNREFSKAWQYGYAQAVEYAEGHKEKYKKIIVSTKLEQPHMFFLFYTRFDPIRYLASGGTKSGGFEEAQNAFDIYEFRPIQWEQEVRDGSILYIGTPQEIPSGNLSQIKYLDGKNAINIADR